MLDLLANVLENTPPSTLLTMPPDSTGVVGSSDEATLVNGDEGSGGLPATEVGAGAGIGSCCDDNVGVLDEVEIVKLD